MLANIYNQKITILNKLKQSDSTTGLDVWYKSNVVTDAAWYTNTERTAGNTSVYIGTYITVFIPFHEEYLNYLEWKKPGNQDNHFTMSSGDYIILGDVEEDITSNNVIQVMKQYGDLVCQVKSCRELHDRFGARIQLRIEGV